MKKVLISGGSGLIGKALTRQLIQQGIEVRWLSRSSNTAFKEVSVYEWDPYSHEIAWEALEGIDTIFHLAGATVAKRWTPAYKREITRSRVESTLTFIQAFEEGAPRPNTFISASGTGYYPSDLKKVFKESDVPGNGFLSQVVKDWESAVQQVEAYNIRTAYLRTGMVLTETGGALDKMLPLYKMGLGSPLGTGRQWVSWIHLLDLVNMYMFVGANEECHGAINAVSPNPTQQLDFSAQLAKVLGKPHFLPAVPSLVLKSVLGEMSGLLLDSQNVSPQKLSELGFKWKFESLKEALIDVLNEKAPSKDGANK